MDPFIGEIRMFAGQYAPVSWSFCNGSKLAISQYEALYALIGVTYGGDAKTDFAIPDLRGRVPIHMGQGAGITNHAIGSKGGQETVTLTQAQVPVHTHTFYATSQVSTGENPNNALLGTVPSPGSQFVTKAASGMATSNMSTEMVSTYGGNQAHDNIMPSTAINYIIALAGIFPQHS